MLSLFAFLGYTIGNVKSMPRQNKKKPSKKRLSSRVRLALVPSKENDYQPHLIRRYGLLIVLLLVVGVQLAYNLSSISSVLGDNADVSRAALLNETNEARRQQNLTEVKLDEQLNEAAQLKAADMFEKQYWSHDAPDGTKPWKWLVDAGYGYSKAGENLAKNFYTAEATVAAWLNSPGHRANVLEPDYTEVGFAVATGVLEGQTTTVVVALYGRPTETGMAAMPSAVVAGVQGESLGLLERIGIGMQSVTPAALGSIVMLTLLMMVAFAAHLYRDYIPASPHHPRHRHNHGAIKMGLMFAFMIGMLLLYGGGQL